MYKVRFYIGVKMKGAIIIATPLPNDLKFKRENTIQRASLFKALGESLAAQNGPKHRMCREMGL